MEDDKKVHIAVIGFSGAGRTTLTEALKEKLVNINENKMDEFELAGLNLTEIQKEKLIESCKTLIEDSKTKWWKFWK